MTQSTLSRSELGDRDLAYTEVLAIADVIGVSAEDLRTLAETYERDGAAEAQAAGKVARGMLAQDLNALQRKALEVAISARAMAR
jgi:hypothetical protein